jgi:hypothetical protein
MASHSRTNLAGVLPRVRHGKANDGLYKLADMDFSNRLGVVVSELAPDEMDRQDQTLDAKQGATLSDLSTASSPTRDLERAVFGAP